MLRKSRSASTPASYQRAPQKSIFYSEQSENCDGDEARPSRPKNQNRENEDLNFAFKNIKNLPQFMLKSYEKNVKNLDLSYNKFEDLSSLRGFEKLETLVLDHNLINCHVSFPLFPSLKMLSLNCNKISNLSLFIKNLSQSIKHLRFLSMMNNDAAPSYLNGGSVEQFQDYRYFVISHFAKLEVLDCNEITTEERKKSYAVYGRRWKIRKKTVSHS